MDDKAAKNNNKAAHDKIAGEAGHADAAEKVAVSRKEYDELKSKSEERDAFYDKYVRAHAEFENVKKRIEKEKADFLRYANESLILEFLPILDDLERAERFIKDAKDFKAVREGVDMIQGQIQVFLKDIGVERIKTSGERFDPHLHEALETAQDPDKEDGAILEELKPGYRLNGRLLRPASVRVAKKPEAEKGEIGKEK